MLASRPLVQCSLFYTRFFGRALFKFHSLVPEWLVKCYRRRLLNTGLLSVQLQGHHAHNFHLEENFGKKKLPLGSRQKMVYANKIIIQEFNSTLQPGAPILMDT